jgi:hypothetical protein
MLKWAFIFFLVSLVAACWASPGSRPVQRRSRSVVLRIRGAVRRILVLRLTIAKPSRVRRAAYGQLGACVVAAVSGVEVASFMSQTWSAARHAGARHVVRASGRQPTRQAGGGGGSCGMDECFIARSSFQG